MTGKYCNRKYAGTHVIAEFWGSKVTENEKELKAILLEAAKIANSEPLHITAHAFEPQGITGVAVLAESHIAIHTWPEVGYAAVDVFTCGEHTLPEKAVEFLKEKFEAEEAEIQVINRGKFENRIEEWTCKK